ncbi:MAG: hypothetical protein PHV30_05965 [Candidatus Margulisbacteria bacterium]|nr:hypothetical protein [Candidatus Margulisiibacteriota bacterium]
MQRPRLWRFYLYFQCEYFFFSPYYFADKKAKTNKIFGFTPLFTMFHIYNSLRKFNSSNSYTQSFCDLGSGDFRTVFLMSLYFKLPAAGIEMNEKFVRKAMFINKALKSEKTVIESGNFFDYSLAAYGIIFLAWTTFNKKMRNEITAKMISELKKGSIVLTLSQPVDDKHFRLLGSEKFLFSWGRAEVFYHETQ